MHLGLDDHWCGSSSGRRMLTDEWLNERSAESGNNARSLPGGEGGYGFRQMKLGSLFQMVFDSRNTRFAPALSNVETTALQGSECSPGCPWVSSRRDGITVPGKVIIAKAFLQVCPEQMITPLLSSLPVLRLRDCILFLRYNPSTLLLAFIFSLL